VDLSLLTWLWPPISAIPVLVLALWHVARSRQLRSVFVSYRHSDSSADTKRVVEVIGQRFRHNRIFHDVVSISAGADFRSVIARTLRKCDAVLVVIGPEWATCAGADGRPRLFADEDIVRAEVEMALTSGALVIPLLVSNATLPRPEQLPPMLQPLLRRRAVQFAAEERTSDDELVSAIRSAPMRWTPDFLALCHLSVVVELIVFFFAGGLLESELVTALGITTPVLAAVAAVAMAQRWDVPLVPVRSAWVPRAALWLPLLFVAAGAIAIVSRALNWLSFDAFELVLIVVALGFGAYSGVALASGHGTGVPHDLAS
jgi:hypothetical protein